MSKISELSDGGALLATDDLIVVRSGGNVRAQLSGVTNLDVSTKVTVTGTSSSLNLMESDTTDTNHRIRQNGGNLVIQKVSDDLSTVNNRLLVSGSTGDISFYNTTGQATLTWDASGDDLKFSDNAKAIFGGGSDLQIFHDGSNSHITDAGTGDLVIRGANVEIQTGGGNRYFTGQSNVARLFHTDIERLRTSNAGIDVTGTIVGDGLTVDTTTLVVDATNNRVGIGTSSASQPLHVDATGGTTAALFDNNGTNGDVVRVAKNGTDILKIRAEGTADLALDANGGAFIFKEGGSEAMRIDASGSLMVGTTSSRPAEFTHPDGFAVRGDVTGQIQNTVTNAQNAIFNRDGTDGELLLFRKEGSTVGSIVCNSDTSNTYMIIGKGSVGTQYASDSEANSILPARPDNQSLRDNGINLGASGARFKDLYLSGRVIANGVTTSAHAWSSESNSSSSSAHLYFRNTNGFVGNISTSGTATAYNTSSDYRLKENVVAMTGATERLKQLKPSRFNFIADADTTVDGFLAHEVQDIVPEAIAGEKDAMMDEEYEVTPAVLDDEGNVVTEAVMGTRSVPDYQGIDQSKLVPLLVATIQELEARITQLENN